MLIKTETEAIVSTSGNSILATETGEEADKRQWWGHRTWYYDNNSVIGPAQFTGCQTAMGDTATATD